MIEKSWLELNQGVAHHIEASRSAIERYKERLNELTLPIVTAAAKSDANAAFDSSVIADAASRLKEGLPEMEQIALTINVEALGALCDSMLAFTKSLENPRRINFILDDNSFQNLANFLQNEESKYLEVFYRICSTSKAIPALESMYKRATTISTFKKEMNGLRMLINVISNYI